MTLPNKYGHIFIPVKSFLASSRAFADGHRAVSMLEHELKSRELILSDWKIHWVAACALLRASIELFKIDRAMCFPSLAQGVKDEWEAIAANKDQHTVYWGFLRDERNNILHEYKWSAYERFLDRDGKVLQKSPSLLLLFSDQFERELMIRDGAYKGSKAIDVIRESQNWVEARITSAIQRAGLDPSEQRNIVTFEKQPTIPRGLLGLIGQTDQAE